MSVWESLQGLTFEAKATIVVAVILWVISEIRHWSQHQADQERIQRLEAAELRENRAIIELPRSRRARRGAALTLGNVVHTGPGAGQHFTAAIQNAGPHMAEEIRVTATLGAIPAEVVVAPHILPPHSSPEPLDLLIHFVTVTYPDIMNAIRAGELLRVQVDFRDGRPTAESVVQCFVFRLEQDDAGGTDWVSHHETCPE